jgi:hypothetical protein
MRAISTETRICGKDDQKTIRDGCPSSKRLNGLIVGHFTGFKIFQFTDICSRLKLMIDFSGPFEFLKGSLLEKEDSGLASEPAPSCGDGYARTALQFFSSGTFSSFRESVRERRLRIECGRRPRRADDPRT